MIQLTINLLLGHGVVYRNGLQLSSIVGLKNISSDYHTGSGQSILLIGVYGTMLKKIRG